MKDFLMQYVVNRLKEPSSWRGIILLVVGAIGYKLSSGQVDALVTLALGAVGAIGTFLPDKVEKKPE